MTVHTELHALVSRPIIDLGVSAPYLSIPARLDHPTAILSRSSAMPQKSLCQQVLS